VSFNSVLGTEKVKVLVMPPKVTTSGPSPLILELLDRVRQLDEGSLTTVVDRGHTFSDGKIEASFHLRSTAPSRTSPPRTSFTPASRPALVRDLVAEASVSHFTLFADEFRDVQCQTEAPDACAGPSVDSATRLVSQDSEDVAHDLPSRQVLSLDLPSGDLSGEASLATCRAACKRCSVACVVLQHKWVGFVHTVREITPFVESSGSDDEGWTCEEFELAKRLQDLLGIILPHTTNGFLHAGSLVNVMVEHMHIKDPTKQVEVQNEILSDLCTTDLSKHVSALSWVLTHAHT
jgi:hypothetical protein